MRTPCVGFCSTTFGDPVCRGCKRTRDEVDHWNQMTANQQAMVWQRLWHQAEQILPKYVEVTDAQLLQKQLQRFAVRHHPKAPPEAWVMDLLRAGSEKINRLEAYGIQKNLQYQHLSPPELFNQLTQEFL